MERLFVSQRNPLVFLIFAGVFAAFVPANASAQAQNGPGALAPCAATSPSSGQIAQQSAQDVKNAAKQVASVFKGKPSQPSNASANPAPPCPPAANTAPPASASGSPSSAPAQARPGAVLGLNIDKPFTPPAGVKIDVQQFGALPQGTPFFVSPHGANVAIQAHAGSRVQIVYDGVPGPVFDTIVATSGSMVAFSPDGNHYGYCGVSGNQMAVMVDGKQVAASSDLYIDRFECQIFFSPNSKHFYYETHVGTDGTHFHARLFTDGKQEVEIGDIHPQDLVFSPDGDHLAADLYAYPARMGSNGAGVMEIVVDGKITNWPASPPVWSADSQHVFTMVGLGQKQVLFRDGQQIMAASRITLGGQALSPGLTAPPAPDAPVAIGYDSNGGVGGVLQEQWYLAIDGKQVPGTLLQKSRGAGAAQIESLLVSRDGKHYAAICKGANGRTYLVSDGKRGLDYDGINPSQVQFTSASSLPVYVAMNANAMYLIVGSQETAVPNTSYIVVSPTGDHVAAVGRGGFLDGQPLNVAPGDTPQNIQIPDFNFSPDGKHYAYVIFGRGGSLTLYVDGVADIGHGWVFPALSGRPPLWTQGNNIVYECNSTNPAAGNQYALCFDGKSAYLASKPVFGNLTLTQDVGHIFFTAGIAANGFRLFLDGVPLFEGFPLNGQSGAPGFPTGTWELEPNGALEILAQDNVGVKRYTITPGTGTSLANLMGGAVSLH